MSVYLYGWGKQAIFKDTLTIKKLIYVSETHNSP